MVAATMRPGMEVAVGLGRRIAGADETIDFENTKAPRDGRKWCRFGPSNPSGPALHCGTTAGAEGPCGFGYA